MQYCPRLSFSPHLDSVLLLGCVNLYLFVLYIFLTVSKLYFVLTYVPLQVILHALPKTDIDEKDDDVKGVVRRRSQIWANALRSLSRLPFCLTSAQSLPHW